MEMELFKDITTEEFLVSLEADGKKYAGLYVDMDDKPSRKYVKDQAVLINDLIKKVDRKRIDESKAYKLKVETEAGIIISRLKVANEPYSLLIDAYKAERAKILADEKAREDARLLLILIDSDHEMALLINKTFEFDIAEEKRLSDVMQEQLEEAARVRAEERQQQINATKAQDVINAENARLADVEHVRGVNISIVEVLIDAGFTDHIAKQFVTMAAKNKLPQLTINY